MDFSKNGLFHSKSVVIIFFQNDPIDAITISLPFVKDLVFSARNSENCGFKPCYAITVEHISKSSKSNSTKNPTYENFDI